MDIPIYSNSLKLTLEEIEKHLYENLMLRIPDDYPKDPKNRRDWIFKFLAGLEKTYTLELLPTILLLLEDAEAYSPVLELLKQLVTASPEETLSVLTSSAQKHKIKKQCLKCLKELLEVTQIQPSHKVMFSLAGVLNDSDKEAALLAREIGRKIRDTIFRKTSSPKKENQHELIYGVFPKSLFYDFSESPDKKVKNIAAKSIEEIVCNLSDFSGLIQYQGEILHLIGEMLSEFSRSFVGSGLRILLHLTKCAEIDLKGLNPIVRSHLGDASINVRKACFIVLLHNLDLQLATDLLSGLGNDNWHVREETINLYIGGMLKGLDFNSLELPLRLLKLLDDEKGKVRHVTIEAFAVISKIEGKDSLVAKVKPMLDELAFKCISDRLEFSVIASIQNNIIQLPRIVPSSAPIGSSRNHISPYPSPLSSQDFTSFKSKPQLSPILTPNSTQEFNFGKDLSSLQSPTHTIIQEFKSTASVPRSTSLHLKAKESSKGNIFKQNSDFIKPPLPSKLDPRRKLPKIDNSEKVSASRTTSSTFIDKSYVDWAKLDPIENPLEELNKFLASMESNWEVQFEYTCTFRKIAKFHQEILNSQTVHRILLELLKWGDSLRSSLSKSALLTLGEFCREIPKMLDQDIDSILNLLLRKSVDTNVFISDTGLDSLVLCTTFCNLPRLISSIIANASQAKSGLLKSRIAFSTKFVKFYLALAKGADWDNAEWHR